MKTVTRHKSKVSRFIYRNKKTSTKKMVIEELINRDLEINSQSIDIRSSLRVVKNERFVIKPAQA